MENDKGDDVMNKIKKMINKKIRAVFDRFAGNGLMQEENEASGERYITPGMPELLRQVGAESCVLLKNDNNILPLSKDRTVSVFGRCQINWFYVGYGSGGNVHAPYRVNLIDGFAACEEITVNEELAEVYKNWCADPKNIPDDGWWGHWPMNYAEMPVSRELAAKAAEKSDTAIVVIGRAAGEERECVLKKGSYYLTKEETDMIDAVTASFDKVVIVLDCGNIIDMSWIEGYHDKISAVLLAWQGGMESGNAVADVLSGKVNPCGRLPDSIAKNYEGYPSAQNFGGHEHNNYAEDIFVGYRYYTTFANYNDLHANRMMYPFGFGLSYTHFDYSEQSVECDESGRFTVKVTTTNTGEKAGKNVVQLYLNAPKGKLLKAGRSLVAYKKTKLLQPGESEQIEFSFTGYDIASFDDTGATGNKNAYVLEKGDYTFYAGGDCTTCMLAGKYHLAETVAVRRTQPICTIPHEHRFERIVGKSTDGTNKPVYEMVPTVKSPLKQRILEDIPQEIAYTGDKGIKLIDVKNGNHTLEDFIAQLTDAELEALTRGLGYMNCEIGAAGNAGAFGGITEALRKKGVPKIITADGPAGLRISTYTSLLPCGSAIASTWNDELVEKMFSKIAEEMAHFDVDMILSPGMNIHRNPLCGRNFEYYSEDPVLSGKIAAAAVRGIQSTGRSACPKHFACNNQEVNRNKNDSRVSERAMREIYFRNFEICVKEAKPKSIMTSYNKINGVWSHYNYDLAATLLRKEWGFEGVIITDWWMQRSASPEFPKLEDNAYRVRAQVDVLMPGSMNHVERKYKSDGSLFRTVGKKGGITRGEIQRATANVLRICMDLPRIDSENQ